MRPSELWHQGDYAVVGDRWAAAGGELVRRVVRPGDRVLDVATGTGGVAIAAARLGASVTGLDVTPALLAHAHARAVAAGVEVRWVEADMTAMPEPDGAYDRVLSAFGAIFAPDPPAMAAELLRVCAPGGMVGVLAWTPGSPFGQQGDIVFRHLPPRAAAGRHPVEAWGEPARVREFFAGLAADLSVTVDTLHVRWPTLETAVEEITTLVPGWAASRAPLEAAGAWEAARGEVAELFGAAGHTAGGEFVLPVDYLTVVASR